MLIKGEEGVKGTGHIFGKSAEVSIFEQWIIFYDGSYVLQVLKGL